MTLVVITPPSTEPLTLAEVRAHLKLDATNAEPAPTAPSAALAGVGAGNVDNGAHRYLVTFVTADGETEAGTPSAAVTVSDKTANGKVAVSSIPTGGSAVTARKLYRTQAGGSTYLLHSTIADNTTTTVTDNTADSALGAGAPSTNTTGDPMLVRLIKSARYAAERETRRKLITQTLELHLDDFPERRGDCIDQEIWLPPLQSVSSMTYVDLSGVTQTIDLTNDVIIDTASEPARITPAYGLVWPPARRQMNAVIIRFVAGYGTAADVPPGIKDWMLMLIATLWENRAALVIDARAAMVELPSEFLDDLIDEYRVRARID